MSMFLRQSLAMVLRKPFLHAVLIICLPGATCPAALSQNLGEWRALTAEEETIRIGEIPSSEANPSRIEADFDGKKDKALIAIRKTDNACGLIVSLKGQLQILVLSADNGNGLNSDQNRLLDTGLSIAEPGSWEPNCYDDECFKHPPKKRILRNPGILFYDGPNTILYFWEPRTKRFGSSLMVH